MQIMIDGTDITSLIKFQGVKWLRSDVDGSNAGRNMAATMIRDRVGTKMRLDISCKPLTDAEHKLLMRLLEPEFVSVSYDDPMLGYRTAVMYSNNHSSEYLMTMKNGTEYWQNVSFPLIER